MSDPLKYKFKELKAYSSTEWLADGQKKYRRVFDRLETSFVYAEFSFYNKEFDQEDWKAKVNIKGFLTGEGKKKKEICNIEVEKDIVKDKNIIYVREGWGMEEAGKFWQEGDYCWEAYIDGNFVEKHFFHIYDVGVVAQNDNRYFSIQTIKFYEGPDGGVQPHDRIYYTQFDAKATRYIWGEFTAKNLVNRAWKCEIFYYFYNDARQLKGKTTEKIDISEGQESFTIASGWGSDQVGTWFVDNYTLEIVFMDTLIAVIPFSTGDAYVEGEPTILQPNAGSPLLPYAYKGAGTESDPESLQEAMSHLEELIGLESIKERVREYVNYLQFLKIRNEKGIADPQVLSLHSVFTGNPGTGKTTVARLLGQIYKCLGLLSKGHVHEVDRADIVGEYIGQTAPKVKEAIKKAKGGILFIDEAYSLGRAGEDSKDYGKEVVEILIKEMSDGKGDLAVVVAGYPREMKTFLESNPGLKSRFNLYYEFPDYTPQELYAVAELALKKRTTTLGEGADSYLYQKVVAAFRKRDRTFGNARYVYSLIDEAKMEMGLRLMKKNNLSELSHEELSTIELEDLKKVFLESEAKKPDIPQDVGLLQEALDELREMTGLTNVKLEVSELVKLVRFYQETGKDVLNKFSLHSVFTGNPGTGKTTVARIFGKIYKALGILERGELIECDRAALVGFYSGETTLKTDALIEKAKGSVLFIDEAYSLAEDRIGNEAIDILLKRMEDMRGQIIVIVAGYPDRMTNFLESNPGLKSRFDRKFSFQDYTATELMEIAEQQLQAEGVTLLPDALAHLSQYFVALHANRNKFFGNGRAVRKVIEKIVRNQHLRLASMTKDERTMEMLSQGTLADVQEFDYQNDSLMEGGAQGKVGFK